MSLEYVILLTVLVIFIIISIVVSLEIVIPLLLVLAIVVIYRASTQSNELQENEKYKSPNKLSTCGSSNKCSSHVNHTNINHSDDEYSNRSLVTVPVTHGSDCSKNGSGGDDRVIITERADPYHHTASHIDFDNPNYYYENQRVPDMM